jgi:hypothetical protein
MPAIIEWRSYPALVDSGYTLERATILAHREANRAKGCEHIEFFTTSLKRLLVVSLSEMSTVQGLDRATDVGKHPL